ncbi:epoxide hydrolase [Apiospora saccharicola]
MDPSTAYDTITAAAAAGGETKRFTTGDGTNYVYTYSPATNASQPTFLLLHGYPSSRHSWRHQLHALARRGYGVLAPDLLGMGDSDKPTHLDAYGSKRISGHLKELLDHHEEESPRSDKSKVIGVGHDWGVAVLSKVAVWYPDRFSGLVFLSSAYFPPGVFFIWMRLIAGPWGRWDTRSMGIGTSSTVSTRDGSLVKRTKTNRGKPQLESFFHLLYHADAAEWGQNFAMIGAARAWLQVGTTQPLPTWLRLYSQPDAAESSLSYYRAAMCGIFEEDEAVLSDEDRKLRVPVVAIAGAKDQVSTPDDMTAVTKPYATGGYTEYLLDAGHWVMLEQKEKVTSILAEFAESLTAAHQVL